MDNGRTGLEPRGESAVAIARHPQQFRCWKGRCLVSGWSYKSPAALHSALDDAGLSTKEFRVMLHICRRNGDGNNGRGCDANLETMAATCSVNDDTVRKILKTLTRLGWLRFIERRGTTNVYFPKFPNPSDFKGGGEDQGRGIDSVDESRMDGGGDSGFKGEVPSGFKGDEGIPKKDPNKGSKSKRERLSNKIDRTTPARYQNTDTTHPSFNGRLWARVNQWRPTAQIPWLGLVGPSGTSKSRCSFLLLRELVMESVTHTGDSIDSASFAITSAYTISQAVADQYRDSVTRWGDSPQDYLDELATVKILVLDDMGKARNTPSYTSEIFSILDG